MCSCYIELPAIPTVFYLAQLDCFSFSQCKQLKDKSVFEAPKCTHSSRDTVNGVPGKKPQLTFDMFETKRF